jgi:hypothetical protein
MKIGDQRPTLFAEQEPARAAWPADARQPAPDDFVEARRLIEDLAALVDAGLVVIVDPVWGPARYGVHTKLADAA